MTIGVDRRGSALWLTLTRPEAANAVTPGMIADLQAEVDRAGLDEEVRVVVLDSAGGDFCAGMDLRAANELQERPRTGHLQRAMAAGSNRLLAAFAELPVPVLAGVTGMAAGFGCALALAADYTVAGRSATFWTPFVQRGFAPDSGITYLLPRLVGVARAKEMLVFGRRVDGPTAASWGMVGEVVDDDEVRSRLAALADETAAGATVAMGLARTLVHRNLGATLREAMANEASAVELSVRSPDFKEAMASFRDKRQPRFEGR